MLQDVGNRAASHFHKDPTSDDSTPVVFDPATAMLMCEAIVQIVKLWEACRKTPEQATEQAISTTGADRKIVENVVRRRLWWWQWYSWGPKMVDALMAAGLDTDPAEIASLFDEVKANAARK